MLEQLSYEDPNSKKRPIVLVHFNRCKEWILDWRWWELRKNKFKYIQWKFGRLKNQGGKNKSSVWQRSKLSFDLNYGKFKKRGFSFSQGWITLPRGRNSSSRTFATSSNHQQPVMVIYLLPVTRKKTKNNVRFETEAWNNWEITHCSDTFYLRASCPGSSLCLVVERPWERGCLLTRGFRRRHSCDMCCSHISDVTYWQWHLNHIWHNTFKHATNKLKKKIYF